jgi:hypothetical protein
MAQSANVQSIEALKQFRASLVKFAELVNLSVAEAEAEAAWTLSNITHDRYRYWKNQVFKYGEKATEARLALKRRRVFDRALQGAPSSAVDEIKALRRAEHRLEIAKRTYKRVQYWMTQLDLENTRFEGACREMRDVSESRIPRALAQLDGFVNALESYVRLAPPETAPSVEVAESEAQAPMTRDIPDDVETATESSDESSESDAQPDDGEGRT